MSKVRDIMTGGADCALTSDTLVEAAQKMRDLNVGALPICGEDNRLKGVITDRDITVRAVAEEADPTQVTVASLCPTVETVTIGADDSVDEALRTMAQHGVRRLPVIDGHDLVGMLSQADIARNCSDDDTAGLVEAISRAPANG
ncbi:MAG: CBS domain-containing protein [Actinomycetota bacterium]|nr:CBS domain-containing protein [Actinomycetota bacterium]